MAEKWLLRSHAKAKLIQIGKGKGEKDEDQIRSGRIKKGSE